MSSVLYLCFFFSGAAGLLYEIYWAQRFSLLLGMDIYSQAAVLTAFMGGLALGSGLAGRWADRLTRPWAAYAWLEAGIGACGLAIAVVLPLLEAPMRWMYAATGQAAVPMTLFRFGVALVLLLAPTALMGATLPIMTLGLRRGGERLGTIVGRLYALNTVGAVVGVLVGGFILSEKLGLNGTNLCAAGLNFLAAALAIVVGRLGARSAARRAAEAVPRPAARIAERSPRGRDASRAARDSHGPQTPAAQTEAVAAPEPALAASRTTTIAIALAAGLTGAAAMMTQLGWTRIVSMCIGSSTYAFSLIVAVFLLGLAIGAHGATRLLRRFPDAAVPWAFVCLLTALLCWAIMMPLGVAPAVSEDLLWNMVRERNWSQPVVYLALGGLTFLMLAAPSIALGSVFPLACEAFAQRRCLGTARDSGAIYAINTVGAMIGSALGGLVLMGWLGMQGLLHVGAAGYALAALVAAAAARPASRARFAARLGCAALLAVVAAYVLAVPWDPETLNTAPYLLRRVNAPRVVMHYEEAPDATVMVCRTIDSRNTALLINGKPDASTGVDMPMQVIVGQLPMLLHGAARDVVIIGLGSGVTLHSVLTHDVRSVELVELSRAVRDAIRPPDGRAGPFDHVNFRPLDDPRVHLILGDGRNHLALTERRYDVIVSEPTNPWIAGVSALFTREYFESCRARLNQDGILCQWLQAYSLPTVEFCRILRTLVEVFPDATVWRSPVGSEYVIIAGRRPRPVARQIEALLARPAVAADLVRYLIRTPADVLGLYMYRAADLVRVPFGPPIGRIDRLARNTDDHNVLRYSAVRGLWGASERRLYLSLSLERRLPARFLESLDRGDPATAALIAAVEDAQDGHFMAELYEALGNQAIKTAAGQLGTDSMRLRIMLSGVQELSQAAVEPPDPSDAPPMLSQVRTLLDEAAVQPDRESSILSARLARIAALTAHATAPEDPDAFALLAETLWRMGRAEPARQALADALRREATVDPEIRAAIEAAR